MVDGFVEPALGEFSFLVSEYGLQCVSTHAGCVRYEGNSVFLSVLYDAGRSFELDVRIGQLGVLSDDPEMSFSLGEILKLAEVAEEEGYTHLQASDWHGMEKCLQRLAELSRKYLPDYLNNEATSFLKLSNFRGRECDNFEREAKLRDVRRKAQVEWAGKNYLGVYRLYKEIELYLNKAEKLKLDFSKKKLGK